jgi:vacuolar-type H+-ATPase subunit B/Vma2
MDPNQTMLYNMQTRSVSDIMLGHPSIIEGTMVTHPITTYPSEYPVTRITKFKTLGDIIDVLSINNIQSLVLVGLDLLELVARLDNPTLHKSKTSYRWDTTLTIAALFRNQNKYNTTYECLSILGKPELTFTGRTTLCHNEVINRRVQDQAAHADRHGPGRISAEDHAPALHHPRGRLHKPRHGVSRPLQVVRDHGPG